MNGYLERPAEIAKLIEAENNIRNSGWELCHLNNADINEQIYDRPQSEVGVFYYGDVVIEGVKKSSCLLVLLNECAVSGDFITLNIDGSSGLLPVGNISKCILWSTHAGLSDISCHFYGWKFFRSRGYSVQEFTLLDNDGWTLSDGVWSHTPGSGTLEQDYIGTWAVNSKLRITLTLTGITQGTLTVAMDSTGTLGVISSNGTYTYQVQTSPSDGILFLIPSNNFNGSYRADSVIIEKETYI